jgi:hypothetical protein
MASAKLREHVVVSLRVISNQILQSTETSLKTGLPSTLIFFFQYLCRIWFKLTRKLTTTCFVYRAKENYPCLDQVMPMDNQYAICAICMTYLIKNVQGKYS